MSVDQRVVIVGPLGQSAGESPRVCVYRGEGIRRNHSPRGVCLCLWVWVWVWGRVRVVTVRVRWLTAQSTRTTPGTVYFF